MKLDRDQAIKKVVATIKGERHKHYNRTVELAKKLKMLNTGVGVSEVLERYNPRESEPAFEQRKRITQTVTPAFVSSIKNPFMKVPSTDRVIRRIIPKIKKDKKIEADIQEKLDLFYGSDSEEGGLDFWLNNRFVELTFSDPNTFIVIEFNDFDHLQEMPNAYPFEVSSENALNFHVDNNNINWLVAREMIKFKSKREGEDGFSMEDGEAFTIYCGDFSLKFRRVSSDRKVRELDLTDEEIVNEVKEGEFYAVSYYSTKLPDWQMFRVGYIRDEQTNGETFVNPYNSALPYFEKSIKAVSEMDLTNALHVFPQKYAYVSTCQGEPDNTCDKGYRRDGKVCGSCGGAGTKIHSSSQDVLTLPMPDTKEDMLPLSDMMAYFAPPIALLDFQYKVVNDFEPKIHQAVFNSTVLVQKTIVATATEKDQDMDSVYDTLKPFARKCSAVYLNVCNAIAVLMGYEDRVTFVYRYPTDFKIKTKQMLYNEIKTINESGAPSFVLESVHDDFANQVYVDDPEGLIEYKVKKHFTPFKGKSPEEVIIALSSPYTATRSKILYLNFEEVFSEAELKNVNFYLLDVNAQKKIIYEIILQYEQDLAPSVPVFDPITT